MENLQGVHLILFFFEDFNIYSRLCFLLMSESVHTRQVEHQSHLLKILWAMIALLILGDVLDPHTPYFSQKTFLCHNFISGRCLELKKNDVQASGRRLGLQATTARMLGCPGLRGYDTSAVAYLAEFRKNVCKNDYFIASCFFMKRCHF